MQNKIIKPFLSKDKLKFSEIERLTSLRSNVLAYHLKNLEQGKMITKEGENYSLAAEFEYMIPYVSEHQAALPAVLIAIGQEGKFFLPVRKKKPYIGLLGLPAGRLVVGESVAEAVSRIMKNKHGFGAKLKHVNSVSLEHIKKDGKIINSFIQILVTASTKDKIILTDIDKSKRKMIKSDYMFLKKHLGLRTKIQTINSKN